MSERYRGRELLVDVLEWTGSNDAEMEAFAGARFRHYHYHGPAWILTADDTWQRIKVGQSAMRDEDGQFTVCSAGALAVRYERVDEGGKTNG